MTFVLITLAGSSLFGCIGSAVLLDRVERSTRSGQRLRRPRRNAVIRESVA